MICKALNWQREDIEVLFKKFILLCKVIFLKCIKSSRLSMNLMLYYTDFLDKLNINNSKSGNKPINVDGS